RLPAADAAQALQAQGIAAGPVVTFEALESEPNIAHRGLYTPQGMRSAIAYFDGDSPSPPAPLPEGEGGTASETPTRSFANDKEASAGTHELLSAARNL